MDEFNRFLAQLAVLIPIGVAAYLKLMQRDNRQQVSINSLRKEMNGVYLRGMVRARKKKFVAWENGRDRLSGPRKAELESVFSVRKPQLQKLYRDLTAFYGRKPDYIEVAMAIENTEHQGWLVNTICPLIGEETHECVALAYCIAASNGSSDHRSESWQQPQPPNENPSEGI